MKIFHLLYFFFVVDPIFFVVPTETPAGFASSLLSAAYWGLLVLIL